MSRPCFSLPVISAGLSDPSPHFDDMFFWCSPLRVREELGVWAVKGDEMKFSTDNTRRTVGLTLNPVLLR